MQLIPSCPIYVDELLGFPRELAELKDARDSRDCRLVYSYLAALDVEERVGISAELAYAPDTQLYVCVYTYIYI